MPAISRHSIGVLFALFTAISFGAYPGATRAVYADGGNAVFIMLVSTFTRAAGMLGFCLITRRALFQTRQNTRLAFIGGFFNTLSIIGVFAALTYLPGPLVIIIVFTHTLMLLFYMTWRGEMKMTSRALLTSLLALLGLTFVLDLWHEQQLNWIGLGLSFIGALSAAFRMYIYGHQTKTHHPAVVGAESFSVAAILILLILFTGPPHLPQTITGYGWTALSCFASLLGTFGMFYSLSYLGSFQTSLLAKIEPIFTSIFSILFIGETLAIQQYFGITLVLGSLTAYQWLEHYSRKKS